MRHLDAQLAAFGDRLRADVGLKADEIGKVATLVAAEVRFLPARVKDEIRDTSPVPIAARHEELRAFQDWSDYATQITDVPSITRASVIVQNYVCFAYLKDACFEIIAKRAPPESIVARVADYLSSGPVRDFRNAFSHANWCYDDTFSGLNCWVLVDLRKRDGNMRKFHASQVDLNFWQSLSRGAAYAAYEQLRA